MKVKKRLSQRRNRGLTLIEMMVAIALFAIIVLPVMRSFVTSAKVNLKSRNVMAATDVAQGLMEGVVGKTYKDVITGLSIAESGFDFSKDNRNTSGKYAFSSINNAYYNSGQRCFPIPIDSTLVTAKSDNTGVEAVGGGDIYDAIAEPAIRNLMYQIGAEAPLPAHEEYFVSKGSGENKIASDKCLYVGVSSETLSDGVTPKFAYMLYTRIEKDNHYYDALITFIPTAQNEHPKVSGGTDDYFSYKVRIAMYEYDYDHSATASSTDGGTMGESNTQVEWEGRFEDFHLAGTPTAVLETGIEYR